VGDEGIPVRCNFITSMSKGSRIQSEEGERLRVGFSGHRQGKHGEKSGRKIKGKQLTGQKGRAKRETSSVSGTQPQRLRRLELSKKKRRKRYISIE